MTFLTEAALYMLIFRSHSGTSNKSKWAFGNSYGGATKKEGVNEF